MLEQARQEFMKLGVSAEDGERAARALASWLEEEQFSDYRGLVSGLITRARWDLLFDCFWRILPFGTGGRRGTVGVGPNRMNPVTVADAVQAHCLFMEKRFPSEQLVVVLAADVREFNDLKGFFGGADLGPLARITSLDFCKVAAEVYAGNGVKVFMPSPEERYLSTPELSFQIRSLHGHGGLNMSASHNHPDDNGAKFYNQEGGQEVPPYDEEMVNAAARVSRISRLPFETARSQGLVCYLTEADHHNYWTHNMGISRNPALRSARVLFSPLHGTGLLTVWPVLRQAGFAIRLLEEQAEPAGRFPSVPYAAPNPELPSAMELVVKAGKESGADLVLATDPDADRIGAGAPDAAGTWRCFNGNQIALLMLAHILDEDRRSGRLRPSSYIIKTEVTTDLLNVLAKANGIRSVGHLLVGFKYIGDVIASVKNTGQWRGFVAEEQDFLCGLEESHGVLASPFIRDKDAVGGALLLAELASRCRDEGLTLWEYLYGIYRKYGYYGNALRNITMEGSVGVERIRTIQESLRKDPPKEIAGRKVLAFHDRQDEQGVFGPILSETDRASRDVLVFELEGRTRLILRPSGTEPKNKSYLECGTAPLGDMPAADLEALALRTQKEMEALLDEWEVEMMRRAGISYPLYACRFSSMLPLDRKLRFVNESAPAIQQAAQAGELPALKAALAAAIKNLGPAELALPGIHAWIATLPAETANLIKSSL